mgnify:FL=1
MKVLVIGLGSMGKRRIRNLKALGSFEIFGYDVREDRREEANQKYNITVFNNFDEALQNTKFDAFIISTPPDIHLHYVNIALDNDIHCFIEASVVDNGMKELIEKARKKPNIKVCPSATLRFHPSIRTIKSLVREEKIGKVSNFSYHSGQYLPDWHPWENVKDYYVSNPETGGCREIVPFELTWLNDIFGDIEDVIGFRGKTIDVGADIHDTYVAAIKYASNVFGTLIVDVTARNAIRRITINGEKGQIIWDWNEKQVQLYSAEEKRWIIYKEPEGTIAEGYNKNIIEEMYIKEMESFVNAIKGVCDFPNTLEDDYKTLQYLYKLENSEKRLQR